MMTAIPLSYGGAEILKLTVSFNYDRYIVNPKRGISRGEGILAMNNGGSVENHAWMQGAEESLKLFQELNASGTDIGNVFNLDPQLYKGLTDSQLRKQFNDAAVWTTNGGNSVVSGERTFSNNNIWEYGGSLKFSGGGNSSSGSGSGASSGGSTR